MRKSRARARSLRRKTVLLVVTGSIAAVKAGDLIQALRSRGARVICVMTDTARHFVTPVVLKAYSGEPVYGEFFGFEHVKNILHTSLAEEADAVLVAPASADFIARLAAGMANDLASCTILSTARPVVIAPAMNDRMYTHPLTQKNIRTLKEIGYHFVDPVEGRLVCGRTAVGHIAGAETIAAFLQNLI